MKKPKTTKLIKTSLGVLALAIVFITIGIAYAQTFTTWDSGEAPQAAPGEGNVTLSSSGGVTQEWVENYVDAQGVGGGGCYVSYTGSCLAGFTNKGTMGNWGVCRWSSYGINFLPSGSCPIGNIEGSTTEAVICCQSECAGETTTIVKDIPTMISAKQSAQNWYSAIETCNDLTADCEASIDGSTCPSGTNHDDWRLPSFEELALFVPVVSDSAYLWTATSNTVNYTNYRLTLNLNNGASYDYGVIYNSTSGFRCVR